MIMVAAFNSMYQLTVTFPSLRLAEPGETAAKYTTS